MQSWLKRLAISLGALLVTAVGAEVLMFFFGPPLVRYAPPSFRSPEGEHLDQIENIISFLSPDADWKRSFPSTNLRPGYRFQMCYDRPTLEHFDDEGCVDVTLNRFGFRDEEFEIAKEPGELRILTIGDSFTFGVGVGANESWSQILEQRLRDVRDHGVQVINGGWASGYNPAFYGEWIATDGLAFDPDVVIVGLCLNDLHRHVPMMALPPIKTEPLFGGTRRTPLTVLRHTLAQREQDAIPRSDYSKIVLRFPEQWEKSQAGLIKIRDACQAADVRFIVAIFPMLSDLDNDYPYRGLHAMVREFCTAQGIEYVDLMDRFLGLDGERLWVHPTDQHPSPEGHRMLADGIFEYLNET